MRPDITDAAPRRIWRASDGPLSITSVETQILDIPLVRPHRFAVARMQSQAILLVRIRTSDGIVGLGEGVVPGGPWWGGESIEGMQALVQRYIGPMMVGRNALDIDALARVIERGIAGAPFAKAGVEMALWDATGKALGVPLHQLLGGAHRRTLPVTWAIGADPVETVVAEAREKLRSGAHRSFKFKMGAADPAQDVARVVSIAEQLRNDADLAIDLNGSWDELTARRWLPALDDAGISLFEQPLPRGNHEGAARLRHKHRAALMADESLLSPADAFTLARVGAADTFAVKLAKTGGIGNAQRIAAIAEAAGIACYGGTTIETSLGTAASVHTFCALAPLTAGTELFGPLLLADDIANTPLEYHGGHLRLNDAPGIGVELDEDKVAKYARRDS